MKAEFGFFTLGVSASDYQLPHKKLGLPVILVIRQVLCRAFEQLRTSGFDLAKASEKEVTHALLGIVENVLRQNGEVSGFNRQTYERVVRETEVASYNGAKLATAPDLCFRVRSDDFCPVSWISEYDGLFVECKPVDQKHPVGSKYCDDGLSRFVKGDYAWAMQEGIMLAYARDGRTIEEHFGPAMAERKEKLSVVRELSAVDLPAAAASKFAQTVYTSRHRRDFEWLDNKGKACDITIFHLWHDCTQAPSSSSNSI